MLDGRGRALNSLSVFFVASRMDKLFARFLPLRFGKRSPLASLNFKYKSPLPFSFVQNGSSRLSGLTRRRLFSSGKSSGGRGRGRKAGREGGKEAGDGSGQRQKDNLFDFFAFLKRSATDNKETLHFLGGIVVVGSIMHVWANYVLNVTLVIGPSMLPTFNRAGDIVLSDALTPRFTGFHAGDVVVAASPTDPKKIRLQAHPGSRGRHGEGAHDRPWRVPIRDARDPQRPRVVTRGQPVEFYGLPTVRSCSSDYAKVSYFLPSIPTQRNAVNF